MLHVDFETRSRVNLLTAGGYNYATDPSTDVLMKAFAFDDSEVEIWIPDVTDSDIWDRVRHKLNEKKCIVHSQFPDSIKFYIDKGRDIAAHNAQFERLQLWYNLCPLYDIPEPAIEQFYCTATQARANNMPATLEKCAQALGVKQLKDKRGHDLIKLLSIPKSDGTFLEDIDLLVEFALYCMQDVRAERDISNAMRPLTQTERDDYLVSELINDRGLMIDYDLADAACEYADAEQAELLLQIKDFTQGTVTKARGKNLLNWVYDRLDEPQQKHMHKYKDGELKRTLDKNARARLLTDPDTPLLVQKVVEASDFAQASSTSKFNAMRERSDPETDRVHGAFVLYGASGTHRFSAKGLQPHNFPRDKLKDPNTIRGYMLDGMDPDVLCARSGHNIMQTLKRLLRHAVIAAPGKTFVCGDWGQIEGRAAPWLAQGTNPTVDAMAQQKLNAFINQTEENDVYCQAASAIYGSPVIRDGSEEMENMRQIGKISELSLTFLGGEGALKPMAVNYGVHFTDTQATQVKNAWRKANPWAEKFGNTLHRAAVNAVRNPMQEFKAGRISYLFQPGINHGALWCLLPSGNVLCYPDAQVKIVDGKFGPQWVLSAMKANWYPKKDEKEWPRITLWRGLLVENSVQGICAVLLRDLLFHLVVVCGAPVAGHTHDEALLEVPVDQADHWKKTLHHDMVNGPDWAEGLPLDADIWIGPNYRK